THRDTNTQTDRQRRHTPTGLPHLCSCAATCTESMMRRRASEICFARTVCCSNLVFTADLEIHSYPHTHTHTVHYCRGMGNHTHSEEKPWLQRIVELQRRRKNNKAELWYTKYDFLVTLLR